MTQTPPDNLETLRKEIANRYQTLSPRLKQVASYVIDNPNDIGLETLSVIASRCNVQPSTIVRFAKAFGYRGASDMQRLFRNEILSASPAPSYSERIRQFRKRSDEVDWLSPHNVLHDFAESNIIALEHLREVVLPADLEKSVELMHKAHTVYLAGVRRSFPVAAYLAYSLSHVEKRAFLLDGVAGMTSEQSWMLGPEDVVIAISFRPYSDDTAAVAERARANGAPLIAISDSRLSPIARDAAVCFEIKDAEVRQFRSLTASMCIAQTLVISYAYKYGAEKPKIGDERR
ncbi:MAG: MurR/RpiR family transcriptional regulator [Proteobacteria bacterium]|jgi:DNA-binding MurR/RpiR family transcriptional regulator|nr:MurR/RpiR family transcriptional regulator [Pseudomonadota bacterium]MDA0994697.1 MurR/RpiR family transcriptional regulator [Pseudomonadota bacterium]